jgi:general secretion pathway protein K
MGAMWLLMLSASIAAALMLRSMAGARESAGDAEALLDKLALDGAAEAALFSVIFEGNRSRWTSEPRPIVIGEREVSVTLSSENGRIDINTAPLQAIAGALGRAGTAAARRDRFIAALDGERARGEVTSPAQLRALIARAQVEDACAEDLFTMVSRLPAPIANQLTARVAAALGSPQGSFAPSAAGSGGAVRIDARLAHGASLRVVSRIVGSGADPVLVHSWEYGRSCL